MATYLTNVIEDILVATPKMLTSTLGGLDLTEIANQVSIALS